jgi:adenosyl cobinamide kinase/adenosyl cobinamide phosphate guanylyltransferase
VGLTLLIGGARSGKSSLAVEWGLRQRVPVTVIATAPADDSGMADRIERHRQERPATWTTIEETIDLAGALVAVADGAVIIDCLTLWTSNLMWSGRADDEIEALASDVATLASTKTVVAITNEVGSGVHPETELGRRYRDVLGRVNQAWADAAEATLLLVAGRAALLHDPWTIMETPR